MTTTVTQEGTKVITEVKGGWGWLIAHERVVIVVLTLLVVLFLGHKWIDARYEAAKAAATASAKILATQEETNKQLQQNYLDLQKQQAQITAQLQTQNAALASQTAAANKAAASQAVADLSLTTSQLAARLDTLTAQQGISSSGTTVDLTQKQAAVTAGDLEQIPALKQQVSDDQTIQLNDNNQIEGLGREVTECNTVNAGLVKQNIDQTNTCNAQIKELKTANLKSKVRWTLGGFIVGLITGLVK